MLNQAQEIELDTAVGPKRQMSVLVIDDSEVDRKRVIRLCDEAGLNVIATEVGSLAEMRSALECQQFDLVFIDYLLVGEDGLGAVDMLVDDPDQSGVAIMIAGEGRIDIAVEAMRRGCSDYLIKSALTVDALQKSVAAALERRFMHLSLAEERDRRVKLENAVRHYANACSIEMRTILAGTLRRVRKLRTAKMTDEHSAQLGDLEASIDRLWNALPSFGQGASEAIENMKAPPPLVHQSVSAE